MRKYIFIIIPIVIMAALSAVLAYFCYNNISYLNQYFKVEPESGLIALVNDQKAVNDKLDKISNDNKYTSNNPYIELNPYGISPLSAIMIFKDKTDNAYDLYINGKFVTKTENSKKHSIPIYGLYEDYANVVELKQGDNVVFKGNVKTAKSNLNYPLKIEKAYRTDDIYFTVASYETHLTGWDNEGKLRFYLTTDNRMDVEWLPNGHFLIGTSEGQFAENFIGFVEMDYLGKVYNHIVPSNGASFEFQALSNGDIMLAGGNNPVYVDEQVVYIIDSKGKTKSLVNVAQAILEIDKDFDTKYVGQKAIRNAFWYNEDTKDVLLSYRGWDAVLSFNYETKKLNWIFTDPKNELFKNDVWKDYLVELKSGRYPLGEHSVILTKDGNVGFFNNGYNRLHGFENGGVDEVAHYKNNYSSAEVYKIVDKKAELVFSFDDDKLSFSHQYGGFIQYGDNYLIDFGYTLKNENRNKKDLLLSKIEENPDNIEARIFEVNSSGDVLFKAVSEEGKFRAFKHKLYNDETANITFKEIYNANEIKKEELKEISYKDIDLEKSIQWINTSLITSNVFVSDYKFNTEDVVKVYFLRQNGKIFELNYKEANSKWNNRVFNLGLEGKYAVFVKVNDTLYNLDKVVEFS